MFGRCMGSPPLTIEVEPLDAPDDAGACTPFIVHCADWLRAAMLPKIDSLEPDAPPPTRDTVHLPGSLLGC